jgi:hypothetical protein
MGEQTNSMTPPAATSAGGTGSLSNAFNQSQASLENTPGMLGGMGMDNTTSFGGQDVNLNTAYADQKSSSSGMNWKETLKNGLMGVANTKLNDLSSMSSFNPNTPIGSSNNQSALQPGSKNALLYKQLIDQETMFNNNERVKRYNMGRTI